MAAGIRRQRRRWVSLLVAVVVNVQLAGFCGVMMCMRTVAVGRVRMVRSGLVIAFFVVLRGFAMVAGGPSRDDRRHDDDVRSRDACASCVAPV
ncbi:MAG: hypothetical protein WDM89_03570 [Rhizomicrobium sp.]